MKLIAFLFALIAAISVFAAPARDQLILTTPYQLQQLLNAIEASDMITVISLIEASPSLPMQVDSNGSQALHRAALRGNLEIVKYLIAHNAYVNHIETGSKTLGWTPLHYASLGEGPQSEQVGLYLLENRAQINLGDKGRNYALHIAAGAKKQMPALVKKMIERGANVDAKNEAGQTPLDLAVASKNKVIAKLLLKAGAH